MRGQEQRKAFEPPRGGKRKIVSCKIIHYLSWQLATWILSFLGVGNEHCWSEHHVEWYCLRYRYRKDETSKFFQVWIYILTNLLFPFVSVITMQWTIPASFRLLGYPKPMLRKGLAGSGFRLSLRLCMIPLVFWILGQVAVNQACVSICIRNCATVRCQTLRFPRYSVCLFM